MGFIRGSSLRQYSRRRHDIQCIIQDYKHMGHGTPEIHIIDHTLVLPSLTTIKPH